VAEAREIQAARARETGGAATNAELEGEALDRVARPDTEGRSVLNRAAETFRYSARGYARVLRLARTIADLSGADGVGKAHIAEAVGYRRALG
jgi:magnesium chelatase family protein